MCRSSSPESNHPKDRYKHLEGSPHNFLRITRILKAMGDLGFQHYQKPLLDFIVKEVYEHGTDIICLSNANRMYTGNLQSTEYSLVNFWLETVKDDKERNEIEQNIISYLTKKK